MTTIKHYLTAYFQFGTGVGAYTRIDRLAGWFSLALVVIGIVSAIWSYKTKDKALNILLNRWVNALLTIGILSAIWWVLREQGVAVLSSHIIIEVVYLLGLIWLATILTFQFGVYRRIREIQEKNEIRLKYLDKRQNT